MLRSILASLVVAGLLAAPVYAADDAYTLKLYKSKKGDKTENEKTEDGKTNIVITTQLVDVQPVPKRAHQGWRYLADADAPGDLSDLDGGDALPIGLVSELAKLGLV